MAVLLDLKKPRVENRILKGAESSHIYRDGYFVPSNSHHAEDNLFQVLNRSTKYGEPLTIEMNDWPCNECHQKFIDYSRNNQTTVTITVSSFGKHTVAEGEVHGFEADATGKVVYSNGDIQYSS